MFEFFERLGDLFSNGDGSHYDTNGHESVIDLMVLHLIYPNIVQMI